MAGVASRSVLRNAAGSCSPVGPPTSTQRIGTGGMIPGRGAGSDQQLALLGIVPLRDDHARPVGLPAGQCRMQRRQAATSATITAPAATRTG
jgi:hypothetical protein